MSRAKSTRAKAAVPVTFLCLLSLSSSLCAQDTLLGRHTINLSLKPLPAGEVIKLLSLRSKTVARLAEPPADEGRPWEVDGAELLESTVIAVNFTETPVHQVVAETLGCIGFAYTEHGDRIVIERAAQTLPADRCRSVSRVSAAAAASGHKEPSPKKKYSWHLASISALEFIKAFSQETGQNIVVPFAQTKLLQNITLRVYVTDMPETEVLQNLLGCIGWKQEKTSGGLSVFKAEGALSPSECRGFAVLH